MSREELKKYIPDTPAEWSFIGSSVMRLGTAMSTVGAFQGNMTWVLISVGCTWIGCEISEYFKLYSKDENNTPVN